MTVACAVGLPNVGEYGNPRLLVDLAGEAEAAGWAGVFVWDHLAYRERGWPVADPYVTVAAIAQTTTRLRIGVLVSAVARRRPWKLARETASVDAVSNGRPRATPRIPSWMAERWPARPPFRQAARWDGVFATFDGVWHADTPTPDQLRAAVNYTLHHRETTPAPFDVAMEGRAWDVDPALIRSRGIVGLTWWIEKLGWFRGPVDVMRQRIRRGPPTGVGK